MLVEIATFNNPVAAEVARGALESAGIAVVLIDAAQAATYGGALDLIPVRMMVADNDAAAARTLLGAAGR